MKRTNFKEPMTNQHAFTTGKSCDTALSAVVDFIEKSALRGQYCLAVFLDIEGAFDNLCFDSIDKQLNVKGVRKDIIEWYSHLLRNRHVTCEINSITITKQPMKGTPLGGILSANIYINTVQPLLDSFANGPVCAFGFADDTLLMIGDPDLPTLRNIMQCAINKTLAWGNQESLKFNPTKTAIVIFHSKQEPQSIKELVMNGISIPFG